MPALRLAEGLVAAYGLLNSLSLCGLLSITSKLANVASLSFSHTMGLPTTNMNVNGDKPMPAGMPVPNSTDPFWRSELHELDDLRSTEELPKTSDIVIIGAGYAGVATAYHLLEAGSKASITLLEARGACSGATGRNGTSQSSLCQYNSRLTTLQAATCVPISTATSPGTSRDMA